MKSPRALSGVAALAERFDVFFLDQFGLLHDGAAPYPGVVDALARLRTAGKQIAILSNSGRRSQDSCARMSRIGIERALYDVLVSSGEIAYRLLQEGRLGPGGSRLGGRCHLIARGGNRSARAGLDWDLVERPDEADLILLAGSEGDRLSLDHYRALLTPAARRGIPMVCSNPDRTMVLPLGSAFGAGCIAALYEELGGTVTYVGKPYPEIYHFALAELGDPAAERVVCAGDSVEHDIAGARRAGLASALVRSGLSAQLDDQALAALYSRFAAAPDYLLPAFAW